MASNPFATRFVPATERQIEYAESLVKENEKLMIQIADRRNESESRKIEIRAFAEGIRSRLHQISRRDISDLINVTKNQNHEFRSLVRKLDDNSMGALTPGVYRVDGVTFRVYRARGGDHLLCQEICSDGEFDYRGLASRFVRPEHRLSVEEAAAYGAQVGACCVCGTELTDPESVAAGIGPVCRSKY